MSKIEGITYSFANYYYQNLHNDPTQLYQLYTEDAKLTHSKIPTNNEDQEIIHKSIETETFQNKSEILKFYSNSNLENCKIRVSSIDHQSIEQINSILISIIGELARTDESPVYRFTQTFILVPGKKANSFDISNDIFRLIPDDDFELNQAEESEDVKEIVEPTKKIDEETPKMNGELKKDELNSDVPTVGSNQTSAPIVERPEKEEVKDVEKEAKEANDVKEAPKEEVKESKEESKPEVKESKPEVKEVAESKKKNIKEETKKELKSEVNEESSKESVSEIKESSKPKQESKPKTEEKKVDSKPPTKLSWAAQISSRAANAPAPVVSPKPKVTKPVTTASSSTPSPSLSKESKESSPKQTSATASTTVSPEQKPQQTQSQSQGQQPQQQRKKFEHLYPVLIKGTDVLSAHELRIALDENFGKTTKVEPRGNFALADFEIEKSQKKALTTKHLKIKESRVTIEPKPKKHEFKDRKPNPNNNNNNNNNSNNTNSGNNAKKDGQRPNNNPNFQKKKNTAKQQ